MLGPVGISFRERTEASSDTNDKLGIETLLAFYAPGNCLFVFDDRPLREDAAGESARKDWEGLFPFSGKEIPYPKRA